MLRVIRVNKKYFSQTLLKECKCAIRKNKMENLINDDLDLSSSDESDSESDNEMMINLIMNLTMKNLMMEDKTVF